LTRSALLAGAALAVLLLFAGCGQDRTPPGLYRTYCMRCHGHHGEGQPRALKLYPRVNLLRSTLIRRNDRDAVRRRIANGKGRMPAFQRKLTREELESLVDYTIRLATTPRQEKGQED
jgi:mono/diheme cytochrome c family protein